MSEADWWLCGACSSLNNLSARKCYSCGKRKPKEALRASQYLRYRPVESWDGKVRLEHLPIESDPETHEAAEQAELTPLVLPPPLREPVARDTLAVAPRPPNPATITYRPEPPPRPIPAVPAMPGAPPLVGGPAVPGGPAAPGVPPGAPPGPHGPPGPIPGPRPMVAVGPAPYVVPQSSAEQWPHWRDLLDGPTPHAQRLRSVPSLAEDTSRAGRATTAAAGTRHAAAPLQRAMQEARGEPSPARPFVPWPEADLRDRDPDASD